MTFPSPVALLLLQIAAVLATSWAMGSLFKRMRQPATIGEIIAGLMLGPSLFGWVWPTGFQGLFGDKTSLVTLNLIAQVGVVLFLFLVGLEFDPKLIRRKGKAAAAISISGVCVPFVLGFGITYPLRHLFGDLPHDLFSSALFMGAAMSVTAFPVLARIVTEWNLQRTEVGMLAIAAAAVDDVLAWTMLAVVVAFSSAPSAMHSANPLSVLGWSAVYVAVMFIAVRPLLKLVAKRAAPDGLAGNSLFALSLVTMLVSAFTTEMIGVHALFGAFVAGLVMPKHAGLSHQIMVRLESTVVVFLLPIFFAYAGLKVDLRQLLHLDMIGYTALLTTIACVGKFGGTTSAALLTGQPVRQSLTIGVLMNTRGLMELIILTVGLQLGVVNQQVYGMMVIMALVTTGMAAPLIRLLTKTTTPATVPAEAPQFEPAR